MKISYDDTVDVAYIQLSSKVPDGAIEMAEGVAVHTTSDNELVGIEILEASTRFPLKNLFSYQLITPQLKQRSAKQLSDKLVVNG